MPTAKKDPKKGTKQDAKGRPAKRAPNQGLMKPVQPSAELAAIVGTHPLPRTEVTKKVWDYIKSHHLQDPENKRMIKADDTLRPVFGGKDQATMFEMTKLISQHLK